MKKGGEARATFLHRTRLDPPPFSNRTLLSLQRGRRMRKGRSELEAALLPSLFLLGGKTGSAEFSASASECVKLSSLFQVGAVIQSCGTARAQTINIPGAIHRAPPPFQFSGPGLQFPHASGVKHASKPRLSSRQVSLELR